MALAEENQYHDCTTDDEQGESLHTVTLVHRMKTLMHLAALPEAPEPGSAVLAHWVDLVGDQTVGLSVDRVRRLSVLGFDKTEDLAS